MLSLARRLQGSFTPYQARALTQAQTSEVFDVTIVGAGMIGTALAAALGRDLSAADRFYGS